MFKQELSAIRIKMLKGGVSPKYVRRTINELGDHYDDLKQSLLKNGITAQQAEAEAANQIGDLQTIAGEAINKRELKSFISLHPKFFLIVSPLFCYLLTAFIVGVILIGVFLSYDLGNLTDGTQVPSSFLVIAKSLISFYIFIIPPFITMAYLLIAKQRLMPTAFIYLSLFLIAFLGSLLRVQIEGNFIGEGAIYVQLHAFGLGPPDGFNAGIFFQALVRMLLTAGIGLVLYRVFLKFRPGLQSFPAA